MNIVGQRLKGLRESIRLSQKELSVRLGITQSAVNRYENNQSEAPYKTLLLYADFFDVSLDYILARTDNPQGKLYNYQPETIRDKLANNQEWQQFVEMCFDPNSPMSARLKDALMQMAGEKK